KRLTVVACQCSVFMPEPKMVVTVKKNGAYVVIRKAIFSGIVYEIDAIEAGDPSFCGDPVHAQAVLHNTRHIRLCQTFLNTIIGKVIGLRSTCKRECKKV